MAAMESLRRSRESNHDLISRLLKESWQSISSNVAATSAIEIPESIFQELRDLRDNLTANVAAIKKSLHSITSINVNATSQELAQVQFGVNAVDANGLPVADDSNVDADPQNELDTVNAVTATVQEQAQDYTSNVDAPVIPGDGRILTAEQAINVHTQPETQEAPTAQAEFQAQLGPDQEEYPPVGTQQSIEKPTPPVAGTEIHTELIEFKVRLANGENRKDVLPDVIPVMAAWESEGVSQTEIANRLNQAGIPTFKGGRWSQSTVSRRLNPAKGGKDQAQAE
ncbi:MAG: recombinase family protein [Deltaproteobacteria bacterium]|nr:recombinase family protein [Deltaproteobacteria bacterium]